MRLRILLTIILLIAILPLPVSSVSQLSISPNPIGISINTSTLKSIPINITNNHNFDIYNLQFDTSPYITFPVISKINKGQSIQASLNYLTTEQIIKTINTKIKYFYLGSFTQDPITYNINVYRNRFEPTSLNSKVSDILIFNNKDNISHDIAINGIFNQIILPNQTQQITLSQPGQFTLRDQDWLFEMQLNISSNVGDELINNPDFDYILASNLNSQFTSTTISLELLDPKSYTLNNKQETQGLLRVTNNGNELAKTILMSSDSNWITFNPKEFDLTQGSSKAVIYTLKPDAKLKNNTGKSYNLNINSQGINTNKANGNISLVLNIDNSLPDEDFSNLNFDELFKRFLELLDRFRFLNSTRTNETSNLSLPISQEQASRVFNSFIEERDKELQRDLDWVELRRILLANEERNTKNDEVIIELLNQSVTNAEITKQRQDEVVFMILIVFLIGSGLGGVYYWNKSIKQNIFKNQNWSRMRKFK